MPNSEEAGQAGMMFKMMKLKRNLIVNWDSYLYNHIFYLFFRVKPGVCYHLYTKGREMTFEQYPLPEILGTRLEKVILQIKILQLGKAQSFLDKVIDPPRTKAIELSLELLRTLNALDDEEHLTPLGYHLARLPLDPRTGNILMCKIKLSIIFQW